MGDQEVLQLILSELREVKSGQQEMRSDIQRLEQGQQEIRLDIQRLQQGQQEMRSDIQRLDEKVGQLESKVDQLDEKVGQLDGKVDQLDEKIDRNLADTANAVVQIVEEIGAAERSLTTKINAIETVTAQNAFDVQYLRRKA